MVHLSATSILKLKRNRTSTKKRTECDFRISELHGLYTALLYPSRYFIITNFCLRRHPGFVSLRKETSESKKRQSRILSMTVTPEPTYSRTTRLLAYYVLPRSVLQCRISSLKHLSPPTEHYSAEPGTNVCISNFLNVLSLSLCASRGKNKAVAYCSD